MHTGEATKKHSALRRSENLSEQVYHKTANSCGDSGVRKEDFTALWMNLGDELGIQLVGRPQAMGGGA